MKKSFLGAFTIFSLFFLVQSFAAEPTTLTYGSSESAPMGMMSIATFAFIYFFYSYCLYLLAKNLGEGKAWFAFIPILSTILHLRMAKMSAWWVLGILVPFLNLYIIARMLNSGVSMRTGHGTGWTVGLFLLYAIFFPITAFTYKPTTSVI